MNIAVFIVIGLVVLLYPTTFLSAATPTPTLTPVPTSSVILPTGAIKIPNGLYNQTIRTEPLDAKADQGGAVPSGAPTPVPTYKATIDAFDVNPSTDNFNIPKLDAVADWLTNVTRFMSAKQVKDNVTPHQDNLYISGQAQRCITVLGIEIKPQIGEVYKTSLVEYLPKLITATGLLSAQTVRNTVTQTDGKYNFEGPSYEVDGVPPPCTVDGNGTLQEAKKVTLVQGFNLAKWIWGQIEKFTVTSVLASKQLCPECERIHCQLTGCVKGSADLAYIGDDKKQKTIKESGGIADAFRTVNMDTTKGKSPNGQEENFTQTNTFATKQMENSADLIKCSLVPPAQRVKLGLDGKCSGFVQPIVNCGTKLPDMPISEAACKLKNIDKINLYAEVKLPQDSVPPTMVAIVEKAADTYKVPASSILAVMGHEQGFNRKEIVWNEENVKNWSLCGQKMPFCDDTIGGAAQAPYGFFATWFYKDAGVGTLWDAVTKVDPSRTKENISLCNFMDVTFAVAKGLSIGSAYRPVKDANIQTCFGLPMTNTRRPASCSRSEWTNAVILQSHVSYAGYCPETNREYPYVILPIYDKLIFKFTNNM